jgi:hypothetical protein
MRLEGGERLVLTALKDLQGDSNEYLDDARLAAATKLAVQDVRDWLEILEGKGFVERARTAGGFSAYVTARGKQALRMFEPVPVPVSRPQMPAPGPPVTPLSSAPGVKPAPTPGGPVEVFFSYSHKDKALRDELEEHLSLLRRQGILSGWHDRQILPGQEWAGEIDEHLVSARVILLLVSPSFLASDYCYDIEMRRALERHEQGKAVVIPVIIRPCDWRSGAFAKLAALPANWVAVTSWANRDEAWTDVAQGIRRAVEAMNVNPR